MISTEKLGFAFAIVSACTFGMMGLFSVPCQQSGMGTLSIIIYRYSIGSMALLAVLLALGRNLRISRDDFWRLQVLALFNNLTAFFLIYGFEFIPSGAGTTIQFSYPVITCMIMTVFFGERLTVRTVIAILLAVVGVACISGIGTDMSGYPHYLKGMGMELLAGLCYSVYLVLVPHLKVRTMPGSKLTFYIFLFSTVQLLIVSPLFGGVEMVPSWHAGIDLLLLGLIPTVISNYTVVIALKFIGSTPTAILGAFEPLTAMLIGIFVLGDPFTLLIGCGAVLIIVAVLLLVLPQGKHKTGATAQETQHTS